MTEEGAPQAELPDGTTDEREALLRWLGFLRGAIARKLDGVTDADARWRPDGALISLLGIVQHLTNVEHRWIDGGFRGAPIERHEAEFHPAASLTAADALGAYRAQAVRTDAVVRELDGLEVPCARRAAKHTDLRWVLLHLIQETARHAGHADAVRELLDGTRGE